jgi:hypothetical protein
MATLTDLITNFGDVIRLKNPGFDLHHMKSTLDASPHWVRYNPRKDVNRFGLSVTSLNGGYSGIPDLDSLREYNSLNKTNFGESAFKTRTLIVDELGLGPFLDIWGRHLGRSHFLRLDKGGFFPPHRDNGVMIPPRTVRILVPIRWQHNHAVWIQDGKLLHLEEGRPYFINTSKEHSVFSYTDGSILLVLNVMTEPETLRAILTNADTL